jgi:hypothetical protein
MSRELAALGQASRMLVEAKSLEEIKSIRDKAEAARAYVKAAKLGLEVQNRAAEVKLRAERRLVVCCDRSSFAAAIGNQRGTMPL